MRRGSLFWGFVVVMVGVIWLLDSTGVLGTINVWGLMWPVFLIALGGWIIVGRSLGRKTETEHLVLPLDGASQARLRLNHGAGRLRLSSGSSPANLLEGDFGGGVDVAQRRTGDQIEVKLSLPGHEFPFVWGGPGWLDWEVRLNGGLPVALEVNTGASETRLDLSDLRIGELGLHTGASASEIVLPARAGMTRATVESGAASINLRIPAGVAARIRSRSGMAAVTVDPNRFPRVGEFYQSPDYDQADNKVDLDIQTGVGAVDVR